MNKFKTKKLLFKFTLLIIFLLILLFNKFGITKKVKKIGVIGLRHEINIGNNLLKYAIFVKLSELGFKPYIIGTLLNNYDISFLKNYTNCIIINNSFNEIKKDEYDFLMVNSDQTWRKFDEHFYDYGFLRFAKNWITPKFIYGASLGYNKWHFTKEETSIIKQLLQNFTGISVREKGAVDLINEHLQIKPLFVLDPTLLIDKKYYLNLISNYKRAPNENYIFVYIFHKENNTINFIKYASEQLSYKIVKVKIGEKNVIKNFIYGIVNCKAVITNSFHGTIFSIMFNKPFVTFIFKNSPKERLRSLKNAFNIQNRIFEYDQFPDINLLKTPLNINYTLIISKDSKENQELFNSKLSVIKKRSNAKFRKRKNCRKKQCSKL